MEKLFKVRSCDLYRRLAETVLSCPPEGMPPTGLPFEAENVLLWERTAQRIYHAALVWRICRDMGFDDPLLARFRTASLRVLADWPVWRPEFEGSFDRNNWANGYIPGAWGLLGGDVARFHAMGTAYLQLLPKAEHWAKRSTNHGAVIYASYLTGAAALGERLCGLPELRRIIGESMGGGCYPEGINYLGFVLGELLPLLHVTWDEKEAFPAHCRRLLPGVEGAKDMYRWSADRQGLVFATFGDVAGLKLSRNRIAFADSLSTAGDLRVSLRNECFRNDWHLAPLVADLPAGGTALAQEDFIAETDIALYRDAGASLCILGSRLHLTHNAAHDCGSFFFENDLCRVHEKIGREAFRHNVPLLSDAPNFPDCAGPKPFAKRALHGSVARLGPRAWRVIAPRAFHGCPSEIAAHVRDFHLVGSALLVLDRVFVDGPGEPVAQFYTEGVQALWGQRQEGARAFCTLRRGPRGWLGAYLFGSTQEMQLDRDILLAGRRFAFPPPRPRMAMALQAAQ